MTASQPGPPYLRDVLADRYHRRSDAERIVRGIGLEVAWIAWDERPINTWQSILDEARDRDLVETLINLILREAPGNEDLQQAIRVYRDSGLTSAVPGITSRLARRCDFYRHIPLPPNYIPRPELLAEVRERLLAGTGGLALTSAIQIKQADVLHGMGGIGKSVLARALCDDPDVQAAFPDGILWSTLGQTPDLTARLREWIETLGGIVGQTAPTLDQLRNTLAEALHDKACLLIVDDAWRKAHLEPFCAGGAGCRLLITTRDAALAEGLDAGVYLVPVMAPEQAVALLEEWAQGGLAEVEAEVKTQVVRRLGCLPLAVRLAGVQLRKKNPAEWLANFDARKLKTRRVETVYDSLEATLGLSLGALDPADRRLYVALAIFKEDEPIPAVAIAKLWSALDDRGPDETEELLEDLAARALLARSQGDGGAVTLHDLLRDFMAAELGEEGRITAHCALLDAYRRIRQGDGWHTAPDDGYLYNHLAYHLDALADHYAVAEGELHGLFVNQAWMLARVSQSGNLYDGYLAELDIAWQRVHEITQRQINSCTEPSALATCFRYALIRSSVNSLAANYLPAVIARAVEMGLWPVERALSLAARVPHPEDRADLLAALLRTGGLSQLPTACIPREEMRSIRAIEEGGNQAKLISAPEEQLLKEQLAETLATALNDEDRIRRVEALAASIPHLIGEERTQAIAQGLAAAQAVEDAIGRTLAFVILAPHLSEGELLQAVTAAHDIDDEWYEAVALARLMPYLDNEARMQASTKALAVALNTPHESLRNAVLSQLAPYLEGDLLGKALAASRVVQDQGRWLETLADLAPYMSEDVQPRALTLGLAAAKAGDEEGRWIDLLAALAPHLQGELLTEGLATALAMQFEGYRAEALAALAPYLGSRLLIQAFAAAQLIQDERWWVEAMVALVPVLDNEYRQGTLSQLLSTALRLQDNQYRATGLLVLVPYLAGEIRGVALEEALVAAISIPDHLTRARILVSLASNLDNEQLARVLGSALEAMAVEDIRLRLEQDLHIHRDRRTRVLGTVVEATPVGGIPAHSEEVLSDPILDDGAMWNRANIVALLAPYLDSAAKTSVVMECIDEASRICNEGTRAHVRLILAPVLEGELQEQVLADGLANLDVIGNQWFLLKVLLTLSQQLQGPDRLQIVTRTLAIVANLEDEKAKAEAITLLIPVLTEDLLDQVLQVVDSFQQEGSTAQALSALLPLFSNQNSVVRDIRSALLDHMRDSLANQEREALLLFCQTNRLFAPPILSADTVTAIAGHIIEICTEWEWL